MDTGVKQAHAAQDSARRANGHDSLHTEEYEEPPPELAAGAGYGAGYYGGIGAPADKRRSNLIDWAELAGSTPPQFTWLLDHWLSWHPTLLSGRGGIGKSLLVQQLATALATARPLWGTATRAVKVLYWACEDDRDEIWRRQDRICKAGKMSFTDLPGLHIDARCGLDNALFATAFGRPAWTPLYAELEQQVNDLDIDVLILDNNAQIFGGNENDRHHVTTFMNGIVGLSSKGGDSRPFCPMVLGHLSKSPTSEYSGSTAWENAARMRWYLAEKLPDEAGADQTSEGAETSSETRFLCKRKTNYSANDFVQLQFKDGVFAPIAQPDDGDTLGHLRKQRAKTVVLEAVAKLAASGIHCSESGGVNYLPKKIVDMRLAEGYTKRELHAAMNALIGDGALVKGQVGQYPNRAPRMGLKLP